MLTKIIKIPGKSFDELSWGEVASMIDACLDGENEAFDAIALNEFIHWRLRSPPMQTLQREISDNWLLESPHGDTPRLNEPYLRALSAKLRADAYP